MNPELLRLKDLLRGSQGPGIIRIEASAGAGKTYALGLSYLILLGSLPPTLSSLSSILAITFANKASDEMKERILSFLKSISLPETRDLPQYREISELSGLSSEKAREWLNLILRNYGSFNINTIDGFIFEILRGIALEIGMRPDLRVEPDTKWIIETAFEELLYEAQKEENLRELFLECVKTYIFLQSKAGFFVEKSIRKMMISLHEEFRHEVMAADDSKHKFTKLEKVRKGFETACLELLNYLKRLKIELKTRDGIGQLECPTENIDKAIFSKNSILQIVKKDSIDRIDGRLEDYYENMINKRDEYLYEEAISKVEPYTRLFRCLNSKVESLRERLGLIPLGGWLDIACQYIAEDKIAGIYSILGDRIRYVLVDEFQDTSRLQWDILRPLVENALSEGGKLICVGDPKQSIYIWRGADPGIFRDIGKDISREHKDIQLSLNYRSYPGIIGFNNSFYEFLIDSDISNIVERFMGISDQGDKIVEINKERLKLLIQNFYSNLRQEQKEFTQPLRKNGYVCVYLFEREEADEIFMYLKEVIIRELDKGMQFKDLAILTRTNKEAEEISEFLWLNELPCINKNSLKVDRCPRVIGIINFLRFLYEPKDSVALIRFLVSGIIIEIDEKEFYERVIPLGTNDILSALRITYPDIFQELLRLISDTKGLSPYMISSIVVKRYRLFERFRGDRAFLFRFLDILLDLEEKGWITLGDVLERFESQEERIGISEEVDAIRVLTIHESKGLEFRVVLIPNCNWDIQREDLLHMGKGVLAHVKRPYSKEIKGRLYERRILSILEALNLLYVSTTRAKEALYLMVLPKKDFSVADLVKSYVEKHGKSPYPCLRFP